MEIIVNTTKTIINVFITLIIIILIFIMLINPKINNINRTSVGKANIETDQSIVPFTFNNEDITYDNTTDDENLIPETDIDKVPEIKRTDVISRAKAMVEVKWTPKYNIKNNYGKYTFKKGKTYTGIPYTMDIYQVSSVNDFLSKIKASKEVFGNDCSGFVSIAWGISRQTTLSIFNSVKNGNKINGRLISQIAWEDLESGDALLKDNGKGEGHIMIYDNTDSKNSDNLFVYEQNVATKVPYEALPVARKDIRSKAALKDYGYIPIRMQGLI
jgi:hypothetical protein